MIAMLPCMEIQNQQHRYLRQNWWKKGFHNVVVHDVSNTHVSQLIADTFKYSHIVLASVTYNLGIYRSCMIIYCMRKRVNVQKTNCRTN